MPECDLVASGVIGGMARSWAMDRSGMFMPARAGELALDRAGLEALVTDAGDRLTFTCTPWGSGGRVGIDRDQDGVLDGDE